MPTNNDSSKPTDNMELLKQQASACGPECGCHATGGAGRMRWVLGLIVLLAAVTLVAWAMIKNNGASTRTTAPAFTAPPVAQTPASESGSAASSGQAAKAAEASVGQSIVALSDLNVVAADTDAVFVFLPGKDETSGKAPTAQIRGAVRTIESQVRNKIGIFTLKPDSRDYEQVAAQMAVPGVLAMVKGRGMSAVFGDITETKLVQAFVTASSTGACCGGGAASCQ